VREHGGFTLPGTVDLFLGRRGGRLGVRPQHLQQAEDAALSREVLRALYSVCGRLERDACTEAPVRGHAALASGHPPG